MVVCLERGADLHMAQLMLLPLTVSWVSKIRLVLPFWYWLTWVVPENGPLNGCVHVCLSLRKICLYSHTNLYTVFQIGRPQTHGSKCVNSQPISKFFYWQIR